MEVINLFGNDFDIKIKEPEVKDLIKKVNKKAEKTDSEKILKSKKVSLIEKLAIIKENVFRILGHYKSNVLVIKDKKTFDEYINNAIKFGRIAIDTETNNSTDSVTAKLMGLCLYYPGGKQAYIPVNHTDLSSERLSWQLTEDDCRKQLQRLIDAKTYIVMHNAKFDYQVLKSTCNIIVKADWDTMIAARIMDENEFKDHRVGLKSIYSTYIDKSQEKYSIDKLFENIPYKYVDPDLFALYAATDSFLTDKVYQWQMDSFFNLPENKELLDLCNNIEMPETQVTAEIESYGVYIDQELGKRFKEKYNKQLLAIDNKIASILTSINDIVLSWRTSKEANIPTRQYVAAKTKMTQEKIEKAFPLIDNDGRRYKLAKSAAEKLAEPINLASSTQMAILLFDILKVPQNNDSRAVGEDEIKAITDSLKIKATRTKEQEVALNICTNLLERRRIVKLITTYIDVIPDLAKHWPDGRVRYRLNSMGTDTGRFASGGGFKFLDENDNPTEINSINSQNIPSRGEGAEVRLLFKATPGYRIVGSDYSGQELRLAAYLSKDKKLLDAYANDQDAYAIIASEMFGMPYQDCLEFYPEGTELEIDDKKVIAGKKTHLNEEGKARRSVGKTMVLAGNYGMSGAGAGALMGKTAKEGSELLEKYFKMFDGLGAAIEKSKKLLRKNGYVTGILGRKRRLPDINLPSYSVELKAENKNNDANFNPILICKNREYIDPCIKKWEARIKSEIEHYQNWRESVAKKDGKEYIKTNELSNKAYNALAKEALADGIIIKANTSRIAQAERQCFNATVQGCLSYDSLIYTKEYGICKIGDIANKQITIWDGNAWSKAHIVISGKKQKCILTTSLGNKIICSPDHKFEVINTNGKRSFKKLKDILSQDRLIVEATAPKISNNVSLRQLFKFNSTTANANNYSFDDIKDDYIRGQVLGRIASDGSYFIRPDGGNVVYLLVAEHEVELLDYFVQNLPFKYSIHTYQKKNQKVYRLEIYSSTLVKECLALDIKHQIHSYFYNNTDILRGFLSGFFDGDGTAAKNNVSLDFGAQADFTKLISQLQDALFVFGIRSITKKYKDRYRVTVRKFDSQLFAERIGFITKNKQLLAENKTTINTNKCFNNRSVIIIKNIEFTDEYIDMFDVCDTERGYFVTSGVITHNSAGTLTKKAMIDIFNDPILKQCDTHIIITVHDEVLVECKEEFADIVEKRLPEVMINAAKSLGIESPKMVCDPYNVTRWYSDVEAASVLAAVKKAEEAGLNHADAINKVIEEFSEIPAEAIKKTIETGCDLEF